MPAENIGAKVAKATAWLVALRLADRALGLLSTTILARVLVPADFGLVAMATSIIAILEVFGAFGFDIALIQNQRAERRHFDTAWTFNLLFYLSCALLMAASAWLAAAFYAEPRLVAVIQVLAVGTAVQGLNNIGVVAFQKEFQFHKEFQLSMLRRVPGVALTIALALTIRSYWALVLGAVFSKVLSVVLTYAMHPYRPRFSLQARQELFHVSKWLLFNNVFTFLVSRSPDFVVGRMAGAHALGIWSLGMEFGTLPTSELAAPVNRAVFPGYSKLSGDQANLRHAFLRVYGFMAAVAIPAGIGLALVAYPLTLALLGPKWMDVVPLLRIMAVFGIFGALQSNCGYVFLSIGRPEVLTWLLVLGALVIIPLMMVGVSWAGVVGAGYGLLGSTLVLLPALYRFLKRHLGVQLRDIIRPMLRPVLATGGMSIAVTAVTSLLGAPQSSSSAAATLALAVPFGAVVYVLLLLALWRAAGSPKGVEREMLDRIVPFLRTRLVRPKTP